jgi:hypothetical protein
MKTTLSFILSICIACGFCVQAQSYHKVFPKLKVTEVEKKLHQAMPEWYPRNFSRSALPVSVDNSKLKFFPAVFSQGANNSCSQASGVRYAYTYEVNRILDRDAQQSSENTFCYHFTWNYLNEGKNEGSHAYTGYELMKQCGAVTMADMNDESAATSQTTWLTGYEKYIKAMKYRVNGYEKITLKTQDGIERFKRYLVDHGNGEATGGVATFSCYTENWGNISYKGPSNEGINEIVTRIGKDGPHALTIVGYDDKVEYDFNGNGTIEDNERGAFIFVNSWGTYWGDKGKCYIPYSMFLTAASEGGLSESDSEACIVIPRIEEPKLVYKIKITYNRRNELFFTFGANDGVGKDIPLEETKVTSSIMNLQGGAYPMRGDGSLAEFKTIEVALNYSEYFDIVKGFTEPKFFLNIRRTAASGTGVVVSFSVLDLVNGREYVSEQTNVPLTGGLITLTTGGKPIESGVSCSPVNWLQPGTYMPYVSPFILKSGTGKNIKMQIKGYDKQSGKMTIKYKKY